MVSDNFLDGDRLDIIDNIIQSYQPSASYCEMDLYVMSTVCEVIRDFN